MSGLTDKQVNEVCRIGQGARCCRYLVCGPMGLECAKLTQMKRLLDVKVANGTMNACADNCEGIKHDL